jgi:geranylgeranyl diphosphate synthase type I
VDILEGFLQLAVMRFESASPLTDQVRYHFGYLNGEGARRGKRLRSRLLLAVGAEEGAPIEAGLDAAAAIEILHNYSLVHDDIEDGDRMRHGRETVWSRYGIAHGINAGDAMCAYSYLTLLANTGRHPAERIARMTQRLHEANLEMCAGQGRDIGFETAPHVSLADYLAMIDGKTAALFAMSCELGARSAGCDDERAAAYARLGRTYGRAFQIRDDVLGTWGETAETGKPSGADIAKRKWSFPVVWAMGLADSADRQTVARHYAAGEPLEGEAVADVIAALDRLGGRAAADAAAADYLGEADRTAADAGLDRSGEVRAFLIASANRTA